MIPLFRIDWMRASNAELLRKEDPRSFVFARLCISISLYIRDLIIVRGSRVRLIIVMQIGHYNILRISYWIKMGIVSVFSKRRI